MGHNAKVVPGPGNHSYHFDVTTCKPVPKVTAPEGGAYCYNSGGQTAHRPCADGGHSAGSQSTEVRKHKIVGGGASIPVNSLGQWMLEGEVGGVYDRSHSAPEGGEGGADLSIPEQYNQQRLLVTEVQRLRSVEEHEKRLQNELVQCKELCSAYEGQVVTLTERLSLREGENSDAVHRKLESRNLELESKNEELMKEVAHLQTELSRKVKNITILKEKVKSQTVGSVLGEAPQGSPGSERSSLQMTGKSFGEEHERELAKLYQEVREKDEQNKINLQKLEDMGRNLAAVMTMRQQSSAAMKALNNECEQLKVWML